MSFLRKIMNIKYDHQAY